MFQAGNAIGGGFPAAYWRDAYLPWLMILAMLALCAASFAVGILYAEEIAAAYG